MVFGWGRKKEEAAEVREATTAPVDLPLSDVLDAVNSIKREQSEHLVAHTKKLWNPITQHIESLLKIAIQLEKDPLDTDDIDVNIATIVKRGKKQVLAAIHKESKRDFPEINSVEDVKTFNRQSEQALTRIGDILGKQTRVIHIFAKKYAGKLKEILEQYAEDNSHSKRLLDRYLAFEQNYDRITQALDKLQKASAAIRTNAEKIDAMDANISRLDGRLSDLDQLISEFKGSPSYRKYEGIRQDLIRLDSKRRRIENEINNQTILISRPISKYEYGSSLDKEQRVLVEKFLSSPFDVFLSQNKSELAAILDNIRKAISLGHMSVKAPEKTLGYIDDVASKLDGFVALVESFLTEQRELNGKLDSLDLGDLREYEKQRAKAGEDIDFSRSRIRELRNEVDALSSDRAQCIRDIESALNRIGTVRYALKE